MPEIRFRVRWPDGRTEDCYSPSTIITEHLEVGTDYPLGQFLDKARDGLNAANERVRARFGMGCAQAINQIIAIEQRAATYSGTPGSTVRIEDFYQ